MVITATPTHEKYKNNAVIVISIQNFLPANERMLLRS